MFDLPLFRVGEVRVEGCNYFGGEPGDEEELDDFAIFFARRKLDGRMAAKFFRTKSATLDFSQVRVIKTAAIEWRMIANRRSKTALTIAPERRQKARTRPDRGSETYFQQRQYG